MSRTPEDWAERIRAYYRETTRQSYLRSWSPEGLAFHMGMHDGPDTTHEESLAATTRFLADRAGIGSACRVLDAGCGVGSCSLWLAEHRAAIVTGVTIEPEQVVLAQRFARERGLAERVEFLEADFMDLPFERGSFDVVWNLESFCYAHDPGAYLQHVRSLLRPGGRFACLDVFRGDRGPEEHHRALSEGCALPALASRTDCARAARAAGFVDVVDEDVTPRVLRSAEILRTKAMLRLILLDLRRNEEDSIYRGHTTGALGATNGFFSGAVTYGYVGAVAP